MAEVNLGKVVGPVGPQGPTGPQGPQGVQGVKGEKGDPGSGTAPNLLCNWYFADPVNQRGKTEYMGVKRGYTIDRYYIENSGKVSVEENGVRFSSTTENGAIFIQLMEPALVNVLEGKTMTISALTTDGILFSGTGVFKVGEAGNISARHPNNDGSVSCAPFAISLQAIRISAASGRSMSLLAVKLELGDHQTLAHKEGDKWVLNEVPDPALELARCQRYYLRLSEEGAVCGLFRATGSGKGTLYLPTPVTMRANPTVRISGDFDCYASDGSSAEERLTVRSSALASKNGVTVAVDGLTDFDGIVVGTIEPLSSWGGEIELDAEL